MSRDEIGLLHGGALGDFVLSWQLLKSVQRAHGTCALTVWARTPMANTDPLIWGLENLYEIEACGLHALFAKDAGVPKELTVRLGACSLIINCLSDDSSTLTRNVSALTSGRVVCLDPAPERGSTVHIVSQWSARLRNQGIDVPSVEPADLRLEPGNAEQARRRLRSLARNDSRRVVLIHPGSGGRSKCWALSNYLSLASRLRSGNVAVVFVIGPVEEEDFADQERRALEAWPVIRSPSLTELVTLAGAADLCVCNDSGFAHLAAATPGARVLAVFGTTDPRVWKPIGHHVRTIGPAGEWPCVERVLDEARSAFEVIE